MRGVAIVFAVMAVLSGGSAPAAPWRITRDHWTQADEKGFGAFVEAIGETNCSSSESCLRNAANPYRNSDQDFQDIDVDCAKLPYLLRAYYAWKNGLPFSYVDAVSGQGGDLRYTKTANRAVSRHDIIDKGQGIDGPATIRDLLASVFSGTYRTDANEQRGILSDFYSPALQPDTIRAGTVVYDVNGHVGIVYKVDDDGRIHYMDAHPDYSITRSVYGAQFGQSPMRLGGGFKNWRPIRLVGAHRDGANDLIGGQMMFAENQQIPDFSLVQYEGTEPNAGHDVSKARFVYNGAELGFYEFVRAAVSGGNTSYNPLFELKATMQTLCNDLNDRARYVNQAAADDLQNEPHPAHLPDNIYGSTDTVWETYSTPSRDARIKLEFVQFYGDLSQMIQLWLDRDPRIVYDGQFLKDDLERAYAQQSRQCTITYLTSDKRPVTMTFDDMMHRLFRLSFDPYDCMELRWGASGRERASCSNDAEKLEWYEAEQRLRNETNPSYDATMNFSREDLEHDKRGPGVDKAPTIDVKALIDNMGEQISFEGMTAVGR